MADSVGVKLRNHLWVSGEVHDQKFREEIKKKADRCGVSGIARSAPDNQLEIILEGEKRAVLRVAVWLLKEPRLSKIRRLASDTEEFLDEFKGGKFQTEWP